MMIANWRKTVNIKDLLTDDDSPENCVRVASVIVERLRKAFPEPPDNLEWILDEFEDISADDKRPSVLFNDTLESLYDWADAERVWLGLMGD